jgi:hypothetical protein
MTADGVNAQRSGGRAIVPTVAAQTRRPGADDNGSIGASCHFPRMALCNGRRFIQLYDFFRKIAFLLAVLVKRMHRIIFDMLLAGESIG